jgi:hypothetical protein
MSRPYSIFRKSRSAGITCSVRFVTLKHQRERGEVNSHEVSNSREPPRCILARAVRSEQQPNIEHNIRPDPRDSLNCLTHSRIDLVILDSYHGSHALYQTPRQACLSEIETTPRFAGTVPPPSPFDQEADTLPRAARVLWTSSQNQHHSRQTVPHCAVNRFRPSSLYQHRDGCLIDPAVRRHQDNIPTVSLHWVEGYVEFVLMFQARMRIPCNTGIWTGVEEGLQNLKIQNTSRLMQCHCLSRWERCPTWITGLFASLQGP